ncbi:MAG: murein hydrolase activator EnvC [Vicinamibacterales bacterium]
MRDLNATTVPLLLAAAVSVAAHATSVPPANTPLSAASHHQPPVVPLARPLAARPPQAGRGLSDKVAARIRALQEEADSLAREEGTLLGELRRLELEREARTRELAATEESLRALELEQEQVLSRRKALEQKASAERPKLNARLVDLYKLGKAGYLRLLLGSSDLKHAGRAYRKIAYFAHSDRVRAERYKSTLEALAATERAVQARRESLASLQAEARRARQEAVRAILRQNAFIDEIDRRRDLAARYIGELEDAKRRLDGLLAGPMARGNAIALPIAPFRGALEWPTAGEVTSRFGAAGGGPPASTASSGITIAAPAGTPVCAVHGGIVAYAEPYAGFGRLVILDHGHNAVSLYGHLGSLAVERGAEVAPGDPIGTIGSSPLGKPELYFELRIDGRPVDPLQWLAGRSE